MLIQDSRETENELVILWHATAVGDVVSNAVGVSSDHSTLLSAGKVRLHVEGQPPQDFETPSIIAIPINTSYSVEALEVPCTIFCVYNKLADNGKTEVDHLKVENFVTRSSG